MASGDAPSGSGKRIAAGEANGSAQVPYSSVPAEVNTRPSAPAGHRVGRG